MQITIGGAEPSLFGPFERRSVSGGEGKIVFKLWGGAEREGSSWGGVWVLEVRTNLENPNPGTAVGLGEEKSPKK